MDNNCTNYINHSYINVGDSNVWIIKKRGEEKEKGANASNREFQ